MGLPELTLSTVADEEEGRGGTVATLKPLLRRRADISSVRSFAWTCVRISTHLTLQQLVVIHWSNCGWRQTPCGKVLICARHFRPGFPLKDRWWQPLGQRREHWACQPHQVCRTFVMQLTIRNG